LEWVNSILVIDRQYIEQEVKKWDELHILMNKGKYTADNKE